MYICTYVHMYVCMRVCTSPVFHSECKIHSTGHGFRIARPAEVRGERGKTQHPTGSLRARQVAARRLVAFVVRFRLVLAVWCETPGSQLNFRVDFAIGTDFWRSP